MNGAMSGRNAGCPGDQPLGSLHQSQVRLTIGKTAYPAGFVLSSFPNSVRSLMVFQRLFARPTRKPIRNRPLNVRPRVERFEDRLAPSATSPFRLDYSMSPVNTSTGPTN